MANRKHLWVCLCLCLLLCACGQQSQPPAEPVSPPADSRPVQGGILTDAGQAETLQDYYGRTAIISRNERIQGSFMATGAWAEEYARLEYPEAAVEVVFAGGFVAPEGMFKDALSAGAITWDVKLTFADGSEQILPVQVLHFTEQVDSEQYQCLSGVLAGEQVLLHRPDAYAYLMLDTRFANRMQKLPPVTPPENTFVAQLDWLREAGFETTRLLEDRYLAVASRPQAEQTLVQVVDLEDMEILASWEKKGYWYQEGDASGQMTLRCSSANEDGSVPRMEVRMKEGDPQLTENAVHEDVWQVGEVIVRQENGSLMAGDRVLLQAILDEEEVVNTTSYRIEAVLDDHRFFYSCFGYEWVEGYGLYDLATDTDAQMVVDHPFADQLVIGAVRGGQALAYYCPGPCFGFAVLDLETFSMTPLPVGHADEEHALEGYVAVNEDMSRMALVKWDPDQDYEIRVVDTATGGELLRWEVPRAAVSGTPDVQLLGDSTLLVTMSRWETDTSWIYRVTYDGALPGDPNGTEN